MRLRLPLRKFETKSTSEWHEIFYNYNTLARFHAAQTGAGSRRHADYISYRALGLAFLQSWPMAAVCDLLPSGVEPWEREGRSVVLIDEIDKAPHDFPNDILNEIEQRYFHIAELSNARVECHPDNAPFIVLTSNSGKSLSDPFLRRCVYFHIPKLTPQMARDIALRRIPRFNRREERTHLADALEFFFLLRGEAPAGKIGFAIADYALERKPGAAELLDWLLVLGGFKVDVSDSLRTKPEALMASLYTLVKGEERDLHKAGAAARKWLGQAAHA